MVNRCHCGRQKSSVRSTGGEAVGAVGGAVARPWGHRWVQGLEETTACPQALGKEGRKWRKMAADSQLKQFTLDHQLGNPQKSPH